MIIQQLTLFAEEIPALAEAGRDGSRLTPEQIEKAKEILSIHQLTFDHESFVVVKGYFDSEAIQLDFSRKNQEFLVVISDRAMGSRSFKRQANEVLALLGELESAGLPVRG